MGHFGKKRNMEPKNKIQWKREEIEFFKKNYCRTTFTREEVRRDLNKKFNINRTKSAIIKIIRTEKIKKDIEYFKRTIARSIKNALKERDKKIKEYKKKISILLKKYQEEGMTTKQAQMELQKQMEEPITLSYVRRVSKDYNIKFSHPYDIIIDKSMPKGILKNKELEEFLRNKENQGDGTYGFYELESKIIERFGFRLSKRQIERYCTIKRIELQWK